MEMQCDRRLFQTFRIVATQNLPLNMNPWYMERCCMVGIAVCSTLSFISVLSASMWLNGRLSLLSGRLIKAKRMKKL